MRRFLFSSKNFHKSGCEITKIFPYTYGKDKQLLSNKFYLRSDFMKKSSYTNYEELPLFLNAELISAVLGISISSAYELMHEKDFPTLKVGNRMIVPKEKFRMWVEKNTGGGS